MPRRTRDQVVTALRAELLVAQKAGNTRGIADCSLLLSHQTARPVKETPDYILAVKAARNRQAQRVYRAANMRASTRYRVGDVVRHREAPGEGPFTLSEWQAPTGQWIAQPGNLRITPEQILMACNACTAKDARVAALLERVDALTDAFWTLIESPCGDGDLDRAEAYLRGAGTVGASEP